MLLGSLPLKMAQAGWAVHIVSSDGPAAKFPLTLGITQHVIPMRRKPSILFDLYSLFSWISLIRRIQPDVVSLGTPKAALLGLIAARLHETRVRVYVLRGLRLEGAKGPARLVLGALERLTSANATAILSVSHSLKHEYLKLGLCKPEKIVVLGKGSSHGVDLKRFNSDGPRQHVPTESMILPFDHAQFYTLGFVGRFSKDKGAQLLLSCHQFLIGLGINHRLIIIGKVEDSMDVVTKMTSSIMPVSFLGIVAEPAPLYRSFDLLLLPTKREGFPNVALEAAACGVPVVTTAVTGAVDSVLEGETGAIVPAGQDQMFCATVVDLLLDPILRRQMGMHARSWVARYFDEEVVTLKHRKFYERLFESS